MVHMQHIVQYTEKAKNADGVTSVQESQSHAQYLVYLHSLDVESGSIVCTIVKWIV